MHYVLLSAPWAVLCYHAEDLRLKLPLQVPGARGGVGPTAQATCVRARPRSGRPRPGAPTLCPRGLPRPPVPQEALLGQWRSGPSLGDTRGAHPRPQRGAGRAWWGPAGRGAGLPVLRAPQSGSRARALQELPNQASHWSARLLARLGIPNVLQEDVPDVPPEYYTCEFKVSKLSR